MKDDTSISSYAPSDLTVFGIAQPQKTFAKNVTQIMFDLLRDNYKLPDATPFMKLGTATIAAVETTLVSFTMPEGMIGVLKWFGHDAKTTDAFLDTTWRLLKNGTAIPDFGSFSLQLGSVSNPKPLTERLVSGDSYQSVQ